MTKKVSYISKKGKKIRKGIKRRCRRAKVNCEICHSFLHKTKEHKERKCVVCKKKVDVKTEIQLWLGNEFIAKMKICRACRRSDKTARKIYIDAFEQFFNREASK